ncbi:MAG: DUF559 domain-containing protein [Pseudomonadota bacterium]
MGEQSDDGASLVLGGPSSGLGEGLKMTSDNADKLRKFARNMRSNPTEAEERLWGALRGRRLDRLKFRRQVPLRGFIVDFVCMEAKLIVELMAFSMLTAVMTHGGIRLCACAALRLSAFGTLM